jgi:hypothetical protein
MKRARGASFSTNETVVDENPLAWATSRIVTDEFFCLLRFTIEHSHEHTRRLQIARGMIHLLALVVENSSGTDGARAHSFLNSFGG